MRQQSIACIRTVIGFVIGLMLCLSGNSLMAQFTGYYSPRDSVWVFSMDSVYVIETFPPQLSPISTTSVSEERIEAMGYRDLNEIITGEVSGVIGTQKGVMGYGVADGSAGKITIHGVGGDPTTSVLIAQNGKPELMGLMGHPVPDAYSADFISDVEIIKGAASVLYGTNALGGVINMETRRLYEQGMKTRIRLGAGNFGVRRGSIQHGTKIGDFDYYLVYGRQTTEGDRPHSAFRSSTYSLHAGYEVQPNIYLSLDGKSVPFYAEDPGPVGGNTGEEFDIVRSDITLSGRADFNTVSLDYQTYLNRGEHEITDSFHSRDFAGGVSLKHHLELFPNNSSTVGIDYKQYGGKIYNVNLPPMWDNPSGEEFEVSESAFYLLTEQRIAEDWKPSLGLRLNHHSNFGTILVPHAGLTWNISEIVTLYGSFGKGFRSPTIREMYLFPAPNPELKPEESYSTQIGMRYQLTNQLNAELSAYRLTGDNLIEQQGTFPNFEYVNSGTSTHYGIETTIRFVPVQGLHIGGNYSWFTSDNPVVGQPEQNIRLSLTYHWKYLSLRYQIQYIEGMNDLVNGVYQDLHSYTVSDLGVDVVFWDNAQLFVNADNLFDTEYQSKYGYPMPGLTIEGGVIFDF